MLAKRRAAIALAIGLVASFPTGAATLTLTGADLYASSAVSFPTIQPSLSGSALVFGQNGSLAKLLVLDLSAAGITIGADEQLMVSVNLTRLPCSIRNAHCAQSQPFDFDPNVLVGDGSYLLGGTISDNLNGTGSAQEYVDGGIVGSLISSTILFSDAGFPPIGETVEGNFAFAFGDTFASMSMGFNAGSGSHTFSRTLNVASGLDLILLKDNEDGEQYQLNFLRLDVISSVPEPATLTLAALGILVLGFSRLRVKQSQSTIKRYA